MDLKKFIKRQIDRRPIEADIVRRIIRAMEENGTPIVKTYDREETVKVSTEEEILEEVFNLDEVFLLTEDSSWIYLVMGNGWDVIVNYTTDLEDVLDSIQEYTMGMGQ